MSTLYGRRASVQVNRVWQCSHKRKMTLCCRTLGRLPMSWPPTVTCSPNWIEPSPGDLITTQGVKENLLSECCNANREPIWQAVCDEILQSTTPDIGVPVPQVWVRYGAVAACVIDWIFDVTGVLAVMNFCFQFRPALRASVRPGRSSKFR